MAYGEYDECTENYTIAYGECTENYAIVYDECTDNHAMANDECTDNAMVYVECTDNSSNDITMYSTCIGCPHITEHSQTYSVPLLPYFAATDLSCDVINTFRSCVWHAAAEALPRGSP